MSTAKVAPQLSLEDFAGLVRDVPVADINVEDLVSSYDMTEAKAKIIIDTASSVKDLVDKAFAKF